MFGPAWLAYGHSFALENEHDQAMAAYFKVSFYIISNSSLFFLKQLITSLFYYFIRKYHTASLFCFKAGLCIL